MMFYFIAVYGRTPVLSSNNDETTIYHLNMCVFKNYNFILCLHKETTNNQQLQLQF